jgi:hypothetical protein
VDLISSHGVETWTRVKALQEVRVATVFGSSRMSFGPLISGEDSVFGATDVLLVLVLSSGTPRLCKALCWAFGKFLSC